jgi:hypothetical protein
MLLYKLFVNIGTLVDVKNVLIYVILHRQQLYCIDSSTVSTNSTLCTVVSKGQVNVYWNNSQ